MTRIILLVLIGSITIVSALAQSTGEWVQLTANDGNVEFSVPKGGLVHQIGTGVEIGVDLPDAYFRIKSDTREKSGLRAKKIRLEKGKGITIEERKVGDYFTKTSFANLGKSFFVSLYAGYGDVYYEFSCAAGDSNNLSVRRFLASIKLMGRQVFPLFGPLETTGQNGTDISGLETSKEILDALTVPDAAIDVAKLGKVKEDEDKFSSGYSRRLFIAARPKPSYTDLARMVGKEGTVLVNVEFRADGTIGSVVADPELDRSLAINAAKAALKIKFVPAQIVGKSVTMTKVVRYTFDIY